MQKEIEPSLLAFDKNKIPTLLKTMYDIGIKTIHYDVMDGKYVKNKSFMNGEYINDIKKNHMNTSVHLMVEQKQLIKYIDCFTKFPISYLHFHPNINQTIDQINEDDLRIINYIKNKNVKVGVALNPDLNYKPLNKLLGYCDSVIIMSVFPGAGGQEFLKKLVAKKIKYLYKLRNKYKYNFQICLDGGVNDKIIKKYKKYIDHFISGSYFIKLSDKKKLMEELN